MSVEINITGGNIVTTITGGPEEITILGGADETTVNAGVEGKQGASGKGFPIGGTARQVLAKVDSTDFNTLWRSNWYDYVMNVEYTGVDTNIVSGLVKECTLGANTIYRFINSTNNANGYPIEDSFYSDFILTNLLAQRGV